MKYTSHLGEILFGDVSDRGPLEKKLLLSLHLALRPLSEIASTISMGAVQPGKVLQYSGSCFAQLPVVNKLVRFCPARPG